MLGRAAMSVPLHRESIDGTELPFGVHLGATRPGEEALLLALAAQQDEAQLPAGPAAQRALPHPAGPVVLLLDDPRHGAARLSAPAAAR